MITSPTRDQALESELRRSLRKKSSLEKSNNFKVTKIKELRQRQENLLDEVSFLKQELARAKTDNKGKKILKRTSEIF